MMNDAPDVRRMQLALAWYYEDDCRSVAMGLLEDPFGRPAAEALGVSREQAAADVEKWISKGGDKDGDE